MKALMFVLLTVNCKKYYSTTVQATKPNIVFVLVNDWGYADVGFRNPAIRSPNFDDLAKTFLLLD
jgi:hypothetical protein